MAVARVEVVREIEHLAQAQAIRPTEKVLQADHSSDLRIKERTGCHDIPALICVYLFIALSSPRNSVGRRKATGTNAPKPLLSGLDADQHSAAFPRRLVR